MTRLLILRHAVAAATLPGQRDFDRNLEPQGFIASAAIGTVLQENSIFPEAVFCSPSKRTIQTLDGLAAKVMPPLTVRYLEELYTEEWPAYLKLIKSAQSVGTLMLVGHNPSCEDLVHQLVGKGEKLALRQLLPGFKPGTLALIEFDTPLADIVPESGYLKQIWRG